MSRGTKTTEYLKECMADALITLMRTKPIEKITIPQIVETAGVGRTTWFRHFTTKSEAITYKFVCMWARWTDEHNVSVKTEFALDNAETFFAYNQSIRHILDVVYSAGMQSAVYDAFYAIMQPRDIHAPLELYKQRFYACGLCGLLDEWVKRGYQETPQEMAELIPLFAEAKS